MTPFLPLLIHRRTLNSPYAVQFVGAIVDEQLCLVMELCSRGSLYDVMRDKSCSFDWEKAFGFAIKSTKAVLALHNHVPTILHRYNHHIHSGTP